MAARDGVAYWRGVQTCGSIWCCPSCAAKIRNGRAIEIAEFTAEWIRRGGEAYMVTLTVPHDLGMALSPLMKLISDAFGSVISGSAWAGEPERHVPERPSKRGGTLPAKTYPARPGIRDQLGIAGTIRAHEVTYGINGWHPHLHVLVYCEEPFDALARCTFELYFRNRWRRFITRKGYRSPSDQHGVKVERCYSGEGAGQYICKTQDGHDLGAEMARADMKPARGEHWVPFRVLANAGDGDAANVKLWHEYEKATFRRQCITWSPVLRELEKEWLNAEEKTDDELAAEEVNGDVVAYVTTGALRAISCIPGLRVTMQEAWEDLGLDGLAAIADAHGFTLNYNQGANLPPTLGRKCARIWRNSRDGP